MNKNIISFFIMNIEPQIRIDNISRYKFIDKPYVEIRKLILEKIKSPIAPFWYQGKQYFDKEKIAELISEPITFYHHNVVQKAEEIIDLIYKADIKFPVDFCNKTFKEPIIQQKRQILKGSIWFRLIINIESSYMFIIEDPYFPNSSKTFNFPTVSLKGLNYLGHIFQTIQYLHDLYNPNLADEWEERLAALKKIVPPWNKPPNDAITSINLSLFKRSILGNNTVIVSDRIIISSAENIKENLEQLYPNDYITEITNQGYIPNDIQTENKLYRVGQQDVIRIFNNSSFELIPTTKGDILPIAGRIVRARCELITAALFIILGNKKAETFANYLMTKKYSLATLEYKDLFYPLESYVGTVYPYDQYIKQKNLETIRQKLKDN